ncbi:MAG: hypothetical protein A2103_02600 [Gammaproteobacteria bacterium GWF2_41_13]|nr:MAG: hypothetical protein A2103_02600 [Gammaproteobacteria bacterium GWF2_41_13]
MKKQTSFLIAALFFIGLSAFSSALLAATDSVSPTTPTATPSKLMGLFSGWRDKFFSGKTSISSAPSINTDRNGVVKNSAPNPVENNLSEPNPVAGTLQQLRFNYKVMLYNRAQLASLQDQIKALQTQLKLLQPNPAYRLYWFSIGALTLFIGLLLGILFSYIFRSREKRLF